MGRYNKGDHVKFEVTDNGSGESEWIWLLVSESDDDRGLVFGKLDSQPIITKNLQLGQELAISYSNVREHRRFSS